MSDEPLLLSFFLPQFHPTPENDEWWGPGFTEWTNVAQARPRFPGHEQPHIPADLGCYDLRLAETREAQAELARQDGVSGFCYYHYWFNGRRLLHEPVDRLLTERRPDFPFALCWANENWTRRWDGKAEEVLVAQDYSEIDDREHLRWLARAFADPRYIRVGGRPLFIVYRANLLPDAARTTEVWRDEARRQGLGELFLCRVESFMDERGDPALLGFDASVEFQPRWGSYGFARSRGGDTVVDYPTAVLRALSQPEPGYRRYSTVTPAWDNSARRRTGATIFVDSTPELYEAWLTSVLARARARGEELVFVNAWNEWGEGCHLEPSREWGRAYLQATRSAVERSRSGVDEAGLRAELESASVEPGVARRLDEAQSLVDTAHRLTADLIARTQEVLAEVSAAAVRTAFLEELDRRVPEGAAYVLLDEGELDGSCLPDRTCLPLTGAPPQAWALPPDGAHAVSRLEQFVDAGALWLVVAPFAQWWTESYPELRSWLAGRRLVLAGRYGLLYELRTRGSVDRP